MIRSFRSNDTIGNTLSAGIIRKYYAFFQSEVRPRAILGKTQSGYTWVAGLRGPSQLGGSQETLMPAQHPR